MWETWFGRRRRKDFFSLLIDSSGKLVCVGLVITSWESKKWRKDFPKKRGYIFGPLKNPRQLVSPFFFFPLFSDFNHSCQMREHFKSVVDRRTHVCIPCKCVYMQGVFFFLLLLLPNYHMVSLTHVVIQGVQYIKQAKGSLGMDGISDRPVSIPLGRNVESPMGRSGRGGGGGGWKSGVIEWLLYRKKPSPTSHVLRENKNKPRPYPEQ